MPAVVAIHGGIITEELPFWCNMTVKFHALYRTLSASNIKNLQLIEEPEEDMTKDQERVLQY